MTLTEMTSFKGLLYFPTAAIPWDWIIDRASVTPRINSGTVLVKVKNTTQQDEKSTGR